MNQLPIYPSQLSCFKNRSAQFASVIENLSGCGRLSTFNRNDWLAQCLGYKGHSDLVYSARQRHQSDRNIPLVIFSYNNNFTSRIISNFSSKLVSVDANNIKSAVAFMIVRERIDYFNSIEKNKTNNTRTELAHLINSLRESNISPLTNSLLITLLTGVRLQNFSIKTMSNTHKCTISKDKNKKNINKKTPSLTSFNKQYIDKISSIYSSIITSLPPTGSYIPMGYCHTNFNMTRHYINKNYFYLNGQNPLSKNF
ncbi:hypothetical protein R7F09_04735 [Vibrio sp. Vb2532]|uniref:hypothetical protein n=1 Tax=Vibrio sp. Vb2532 TaxID=3074666 RepID=UPI0029641C67|nr:hypothetical protein [Vibrio sp. Vb2532]MDW1766677.1 hypothetical protein [Vibrio sp. Vb2532]